MSFGFNIIYFGPAYRILVSSRLAYDIIYQYVEIWSYITLFSSNCTCIFIKISNTDYLLQVCIIVRTFCDIRYKKNPCYLPVLVSPYRE